MRAITWFKAHFTMNKLWRVKYDNEPRFTRLLEKSEAKELAKCFEGKAWIDYDSALELYEKEEG